MSLALRSTLGRCAVTHWAPSVSTVLRRGMTVRTASLRRYSSSVHDNDPETLEQEKQKNLSGKQHKGSAPHENAPGWNEYLATESEADVKADHSEPDPPEVLTKKTIDRLIHRYNPDDVTEGMEASYEKDEVEGPLKKLGNVVEKVVDAVKGEAKKGG